MYRQKRTSSRVDIDFTLRRVFGKKSFRPLQRQVITAAIDGQDIFLQAATSFGKSLCFQLPAVVSNGITVVISPLLALMNNQIAALESQGVAVATINSNTPLNIRNEIQADILCGHPRTRLLYVTPEFCQTDSFRKNLVRIHGQGQLERIAIDEAHCISEWGHDFRPAYKELDWFKKTLILPSVPIIAVTATATPRVQSDVITSLGLNRDTLSFFAMSTARPNIHYEIIYTPPNEDPFDSLVEWLHACNNRRTARLEAADPANPPPKDLPQISGIIYTHTRKTTETLSAKLRSQAIGAAAYHAGLTTPRRVEVQTQWLENKPEYAVIVATTAFGMGIDKDDVRFVVHWDLPNSFEGYYQEAGRAGRDGKAAVSRVYYSHGEREATQWRLARDSDPTANVGFRRADNVSKTSKKEQRLASFAAFCAFCESTTKCRHDLIKSYFAGEALSGQTGPNQTRAPPGNPLPPSRTVPAESEEPRCDLACDFCKFGPAAMKRRKEKGFGVENERPEASQWANAAEIEAGWYED